MNSQQENIDHEEERSVDSADGSQSNISGLVSESEDVPPGAGHTTQLPTQVPGFSLPATSSDVTIFSIPDNQQEDRGLGGLPPSTPAINNREGVALFSAAQTDQRG